MSEMIERVARAICYGQGVAPLPDRVAGPNQFLSKERCIEMAKCAIEAMREPTWEMITNARRVQLLNPDEYESEKGYFAQAYKYMIDAALK